MDALENIVLYVILWFINLKSFPNKIITDWSTLTRVCYVTYVKDKDYKP